MAEHAILSASSASRWLQCPPSARLEEKEPDTSSSYADEGSMAHELCELLLRKKANRIDTRSFTRKLNALKNSEYYCGEMMECCESYADTVMEKYASAISRTKDAKLIIEQKLDFSPYVPEGFGTGDALIIADDIIEVIDFKYGKGVPVSADYNPQMMLYGLGALNEFDMLYDINTIRMTILQPRLENISEYNASKEDLISWGESIKPIAVTAFKGEGEFKSGKHCQFCKIKAKCRFYAEQQMELAVYEFKEGPFLQDHEITDILDKMAEFKNWLTAVEEYALDQALNHGKEWPGYKIVEGRSNRKYADPDSVVKVLLEKGYKEEMLYKPLEVLGITAMQSLLGKKTFESLLSDYIVKPPGKPTLVPLDDSRPALQSEDAARNDFENN